MDTHLSLQIKVFAKKIASIGSFFENAIAVGSSSLFPAWEINRVVFIVIRVDAIYIRSRLRRIAK